MIYDFDELNNIRSMPFEKYFGEMPLTDEQKEKRISISEEFYEMMIYFFELYDLSDNDTEIENALQARFLAIVSGYKALTEYDREYAKEFASEIVKATKDHADDKYFLSYDRARLVAENEANTLFNRTEYDSAKSEGKTKKQWIDMKDNLVRPTHKVVGGTVIGIDELFSVGATQMRYPKDYELASDTPEELINCRCCIRYF